MIKKNSFATFAILGILSMMLLIGCGGAAGGGSSSSSGSGGGSGASTASTTIGGSVVDGIIVGATVQAYQINAVNGTRGSQIGSATTTDNSGNYTLNLGTYTGPVLIEATGGSYTDWATGATVTLTATDKLSAVVSNATGSVTAQITPLTYMAAQRAMEDIYFNSTAVATAIDNANTFVGAYFGGFNIITDKPIDPTAAGSASGASQNSIDYGMVLAGISRTIEDFSLFRWSPPWEKTPATAPLTASRMRHN